ncbi:hypothetical protein MMC19_005437 [Ptychographa xylographoides]|nr:hypothetical protein [Ptychographa xylographoides]
MSFTLTIPREYGYVVLSAISITFVNTWLGSRVGAYRKAAKVPYPNAYASANEAATSKEKYLFNCAQRAHANFLEAQPSVMTTLLVSGLGYPLLSAGMGILFAVSRVVYAVGYTSPNIEGGKGRYYGSTHYIAQLALAVMSGLVAWNLIAN